MPSPAYSPTYFKRVPGKVGCWRLVRFDFICDMSGSPTRNQRKRNAAWINAYLGSEPAVEGSR